MRSYAKYESFLMDLGRVTGALLDEDVAGQFVATLASDEEGSDRVWLWTQHLRDRLTALLVIAGREEER